VNLVSLRRRLTVGAVAASAVVLPAAAAARAPASSPRLQSPSLVEIARGPAVVPEGVAQAPRGGSYWGGRYTVASGETVEVLFSNTYPQDQAAAQHWADFVASLIHGPELASVTLYLAPSREVSRNCGFGALACYNPSTSLLVASAEDPDPEISAESVVAHEYGHHIAAHRVNAPWVAVDWGTKRWATYEQVCARTRGGTLFPGDEQQHYRLNPGEWFAESYRVLNERRLGMTESAWEIVDGSLVPDDAALSLLEQDVVTPWIGSTAASFTASLARTRTYSISTPLDGTLTATLRLPARARARLDLLSPTGAVLVRGATTVRATVCGTRSYRVRVTRLGGAGTFRLAVAKP
jgi:hypothetical protein